MPHKNGHSHSQLPPIAPDSIMLHLVASTARLEVGVDNLNQRVERVEQKLDQPPPPPATHIRPLSDYLPALYGAVILVAVVTGKLTVLQGLSIFKGG